MKYFLFCCVLILIACKSSRDMDNVHTTSPSSEPIALDLDYEGETLNAIQRDKIAEAELKVQIPAYEFHPGNLQFSSKANQPGTLDHYLAERNNSRDLLYIPKPGVPGTLYKNLPYDGEEIPTIHLDNATLGNIRSTKGTIVVPQVIEEK